MQELLSVPDHRDRISIRASAIRKITAGAGFHLARNINLHDINIMGMTLHFRDFQSGVRCISRVWPHLLLLDHTVWSIPVAKDSPPSPGLGMALCQGPISGLL